MLSTFQADTCSREANVFHHPDHSADLPHLPALSVDNLAKEYFGDKAGMLGYVEGVQRKEIRQGYRMC